MGDGIDELAHRGDRGGGMEGVVEGGWYGGGGRGRVVWRGW